MIITDTDRLEWLLKPGREFDYEVENHKVTHWYVKWFRESVHYVAYGKTQRECIDNAILGNVESW